MDCLCIILAEFGKLTSSHIGTGVHEEWRLASTLEGEVSKLQNVAFDHELDELLLVCLAGHAPSPVSFQRTALHCTGILYMMALCLQ